MILLLVLFPLSEEARFYISSAFTRGWLILLFTVIRNYIIDRHLLGHDKKTVVYAVALLM